MRKEDFDNKGQRRQGTTSTNNITMSSDKRTSGSSSSSPSDGPSLNPPLSLQEDGQALSIHDWLSIGQFESALSQSNEKEEEIHRLPFLLRLLSSSQQYSSIPSVFDDKGNGADNEDAVDSTFSGTTKNKSTTSSIEYDPLVNKIVSKLEVVAAKHSEAESVDALTGYHAPTMTRRLSRLPYLTRQTKYRQWDTDALLQVSKSPLEGGAGGKRRNDGGSNSAKRKRVESNLDDSNDEDEDMERVGEGSGTEGENEDYGRRDSISTGRENLVANSQGEDSQEAMVLGTLKELCKLVAESLDQPDEPDHPPTENAGGAGGDEEEQQERRQLKADNLLSESNSTTTMGGTDLGATVAALMHHLPVLRHQHVAVSPICGTPFQPTVLHTHGSDFMVEEAN